MVYPLTQDEQKPMRVQVWQLLIKQKGWQLLPESWYPNRQEAQVLVPLHEMQLVTPQLGTQVPLEKVLSAIEHAQTGVEEFAGVEVAVPAGQPQVLLERMKEGRQVSH